MKFHCSIDIGAVLNADPRVAGAFFKEGGKPMSSERAKTLATILRAKGYEAIPLGCDNHDAAGYCLGHPEEPLCA